MYGNGAAIGSELTMGMNAMTLMGRHQGKERLLKEVRICVMHHIATDIESPEEVQRRLIVL
jgi:hypothetical protein